MLTPNDYLREKFGAEFTFEVRDLGESDRVIDVPNKHGQKATIRMLRTEFVVGHADGSKQTVVTEVDAALARLCGEPGPFRLSEDLRQLRQALEARTPC